MAAPTRDDVLERIEALGPPGTPVTTPEVAEGFDCTKRTIYNRLDSLAEDGVLQTKKVGANSRVWWRPVDVATQNGGALPGRERVRPHPVFDSDLVGVLVWKPDPTSSDPVDLVIEDANDAFLEMAGPEYDDALGTPWQTLTPEEFYPESEAHIEQVIETGSGLAYDKQYYHADGSRWWGLFESRMLDDGRFVEFVVDITERKEVEQNLRESEERFRAVANLVPSLLWSNDPEGSTFWYNQQWIDYTGQTMEDAADYGWLDAIHPDDREQSLENFQRAVDAGEPLRQEHRIRRHDGEYHWFLVQARPVRDGGEISRWFGAATDIHDQREMRATLERLNAVTRDLLDAESATIEDRVAEFVREILGVEYAALWRYNDQHGDLEEHAVDTAPDVDRGSVSPSTELSELVWQTFVGSDVDVATDLDGLADTWGSLESRVLVPLGRHGVVCLGSTRAGTFDERTVDLVEMVAATVETAWDRAAGEAELADRNEELVRLDRLNRSSGRSTERSWPPRRARRSTMSSANGWRTPTSTSSPGSVSTIWELTRSNRGRGPASTAATWRTSKSWLGTPRPIGTPSLVPYAPVTRRWSRTSLRTAGSLPGGKRRLDAALGRWYAFRWSTTTQPFVFS